MVKLYIDAYNSFNINAMLSVLHNDIEFKNISNGIITVESRGLSKFRQLAE